MVTMERIQKAIFDAQGSTGAGGGWKAARQLEIPCMFHACVMVGSVCYNHTSGIQDDEMPK